MGKDKTKTKDRQPTWCDNVANKLYTTIMIALVGFALTAQQTVFADTKATNEHNYKIGLKFGHEEYHQCYTTHSCATSENYYTSGCENTGINLGPNPVPNHVDNKTACEHGYTHGWIHECLIDGGGGSCKPQPSPTTYTHTECIASGHSWEAGSCQSGTLVAVTGPTVCHHGDQTPPLAI